MEKLAKIIEAKAMAKFFAQCNTLEKRSEFMLKHARVEDFLHFINTEISPVGNSCTVFYANVPVIKMMSNDFAEKFIKKVLYPRMKDQYIEMIVNELESKLEPTIKITIEKS